MKCVRLIFSFILACFKLPVRIFSYLIELLFDDGFVLLDVEPAFAHDILLTDINKEGYKQFSRDTGVEHLSSGAFPKPEAAYPIEGLFFGPNHRFMVCLNCQRANRQSAPIIKVWFLIDTGAAHTYIAKETIEKLTESDHIPESMSVAIQESSGVIKCHLSHDKFAEANLLGAIAMLELKLTIEAMNTNEETFFLAKQ